ncbi:MAG: helix-turn-helix transcriptional regulator [Acidimicrobiales bacterium]
MANRPTAPDRLRRVLAVVPWIVANPGRPVGEVAARFGLSESDLLADLNVVFMVGLPPYSPDALVDVQIDDEGRVSIRLADFFSRPLRLTPGQGLALLASADGLLSIPGTDPDGALARALHKLRTSLGVAADGTIDVHLGAAEAAQLDELRRAAVGGNEVRITYYSYGRDERNQRVIAPWRVFADAGSWYVHAWCRSAEGERVFRVDRIEDLAVLGSATTHRPEEATEGPGVYHPGPDDPRVTLELEATARWVVDSYPATMVEERADGSVLVELAVSAVPWLERLLLRLGPAGRVVAADGLDDAREIGPRTATRVLARYR